MKKILVLALALAICAVMFSCGAPKEDAAQTTEAVQTTVAETTAALEEDSIDTVIESIDLVLSTMKNGTVEEYAALTGMKIDDTDPMTKQMIEAMFKKFDYALGAAANVDDTHATVDAKITSLDVMGALMAYMTVASQAENPETFDEDGAIFMEMLTAEDAATVTNDIKINLEKVDGAWTLSEDNQDFTNALSGGLAG